MDTMYGPKPRMFLRYLILIKFGGRLRATPRSKSLSPACIRITETNSYDVHWVNVTGQC